MHVLKESRLHDFEGPFSHNFAVAGCADDLVGSQEDGVKSDAVVAVPVIL